MGYSGRNFFWFSLLATLGIGLVCLFIFFTPALAIDVTVTGDVSGGGGGGSCGDSVLDSGEACDGAAGSGNCYNSSCNSDCSCPVCGNSTVEAGEDCESDSQCSTGQTCNSSCLCQTTGGGPQPCTPGSLVCNPVGSCQNNQQTISCTNGCTTSTNTVSCGLAVCGNNVVETGETCDDSSACCTGSCATTGAILGVTEVPSNTSALIGWQTQDWSAGSCQSASSSSLIEWGTTVSYTGGSANLSGSSYSYNISGLTANTLYFYRITATLASGQQVYTDSFVTTGGVEICNNGLDDDNDGLVDIADPNCPCTATWVCNVDDVDDALCVDSQKVKSCAQAPTDQCWDTSTNPSEVIGCGLCEGVSCPFGQEIIDQNTCECGIVPGVCGNAICEPTFGETPVTCSLDCPVDCLSDWQCGDWNPLQCPASGVQSRTCVDLNGCAVPINQPSLSQSCGGVCPGLSCNFGETINTQICACEAIVPFCGNAICESGEDFQGCPADCVELCLPNWLPSAWGSCVNGVQQRSVTDLNQCNFNLDRPPEIRSCDGVCEPAVACHLGQNIDLVNCRCIDIVPFCGNSICENGELTWSCPVDCGLPPDFRLALTACLDGLDNDQDGNVDYPADAGCSSPADPSELDLAEIVQGVLDLLDNPQVEQVNEVVAPAIIATVAVNAIASFSLFNFASYARYLFTQPFAVIARRKRKKWGVVYNALTKQPVDLAIVRLYDKATNRIVQSRVTDRQGRYSFLAAPGRYYITVTKPQFTFPTGYLKNEKEDASFLDLYHGETIEVTEANASITANIPIDSEVKEKPARQVIVRHYLRKIQYIVAFSAIPLAIFSVVISPGLFTATLLGFHILLYILFRRLGYQKPPKNWGVVYEAGTKHPVGRAVTRIYDRKYNKLLETRVTDAKGRYAFLVNNNVYVVTAEKLGYQPFKTNDIDLVNKKVETIVGMDIGLNKAQAGQAAPIVQPVTGVPAVGGLTQPLSGATTEPKSLSPADVKRSLEQTQSAEAALGEKVDELSVDRSSLEDLVKQKEKLVEVKKEIDARQDKLEQLEEKVDTLEHKIEEKIEQVEPQPPKAKPVPPKPESAKPSEPAPKPPTKSIFS